MPYLANISTYPLKSLDPASVTCARIVAGGGLEHDREYALFDIDGKYVNGKRQPKVHLLESRLDDESREVLIAERGSGIWRSVDDPELGDWLSAFLDTRVVLRRNTAGGFPDDKNSPGPTVIGTETYNTVASWFPRLSVGEIRRRFRVNLEFEGVPPFWEDCLYGEPHEVRQFRVGDVLFEGTNPCQRCVVPTRDTRTGEQDDGFANTFRARRQDTLPSWAAASRFNHYYRLAVNTRIPESETGKSVRVGDEVALL